MTIPTDREELAKLLFMADNNGAPDPAAEWEAARPSQRHPYHHMADALIPVLEASKRELVEKITTAARNRLNGWVEGDSVPESLPADVLAAISEAAQ
jgi:hypothetical protein